MSAGPIPIEGDEAGPARAGLGRFEGKAPVFAAGPAKFLGLRPALPLVSETGRERSSDH